MKRFSLIACVVLCGVSVLVMSARKAESGQSDAIVRLQQASPGVQQIGNFNLSGIGIAGSGLQGLTSANNGRGVFGNANNAAASTYSYGGFFQAAGPFGRGVTGIASHASGGTYGVEGVCASTQGRGVQGFASASSGVTYGVWGESASPSGQGVFGVATSVNGFNYGTIGETHSIDGRGVYGLATATSGFTYGVVGRSQSASGQGVYGVVSSPTGLTYGVVGETYSADGRAIYGLANSATGVSYGVWGQSNSANGFAVWAQGRTGASGTKSFRIDHPFDPTNKYLLHYSSEGPEPLNVYSGTARTDGSGSLTVKLPDYFEEINRDPRIQLTVDDSSDDFVLVKVVGGVKDGEFRIRTSKPNIKVYWEVKAVRNDLWVRHYGAPIEIDKQGSEKGTYQNPELYGKPENLGMTYKSRSTTVCR